MLQHQWAWFLVLQHWQGWFLVPLHWFLPWALVWLVFGCHSIVWLSGSFYHGMVLVSVEAFLLLSHCCFLLPQHHCFLLHCCFCLVIDDVVVAVSCWQIFLVRKLLSFHFRNGSRKSVFLFLAFFLSLNRLKYLPL